MSDAKVRVSVLEGTIEIEGTESFVGAQLEKFGDSIRAGLAGVRPTQQRSRDGNGATSGQRQDDGGGSSGSVNLDDVFAATEKGVQILHDIPGNTKSEKMVNAGKLLVYGMAKLKSKDTVFFEEVKAVCKAHGCYDGTNMATALKEQKTA